MRAVGCPRHGCRVEGSLVPGARRSREGGECDFGYARKAGRLGLQVEGYRTWLGQRGYARETARNMLKELGQVARWLATQAWTRSSLTRTASRLSCSPEASPATGASRESTG